MDIVCYILALLFLFAVVAIFSLNDKSNRILKKYKACKQENQDQKYTIYHMQTMIELRDKRVKAQSETIKRLENEKNAYFKP